MDTENLQLLAPPTPPCGEGGAVVGDMIRKYCPGCGANVMCIEEAQVLCIPPCGHFCYGKCDSGLAKEGPLGIVRPSPSFASISC